MISRGPSSNFVYVGVIHGRGSYTCIGFIHGSNPMLVGWCAAGLRLRQQTLVGLASAMAQQLGVFGVALPLYLFFFRVSAIDTG